MSAYGDRGVLYETPDYVWVLFYNQSGRRIKVVRGDSSGERPKALKSWIEWLERSNRKYKLVRYTNPYSEDRLFDLDPIAGEKIDADNRVVI